MNLYDDRLSLAPRATTARPAEFEVVMLGHCPGRHDVAALLNDRASVQEIRDLGFSNELDALSLRLDSAVPGDSTATLERLPIPLTSIAQFQRLFPEAASTPARYESLLGGARAWLPACVGDFFTATRPGVRKLWAIAVPEGSDSEAPAQHEFLPRPGENLLRPEELSAFHRALLIPNVAVIAMPDLERLQIPARLPDIRRVRLPNREPAFLPCSTMLDDAHRERRYSDEIPLMPEPLASGSMIGSIVRALGRARPDVQCLYSLPPAYRSTGSATIAYEAISWLNEHRSDEASGLHRVQFLFPYLSSPGGALRSSVGAVAAAIAHQSMTRGPWRSVAGQRLGVNGQVFPSLDRNQAIGLRELPGIGVLMNRRGGIELSDERLVAPIVGRAGFPTKSGRRQHLDDYRSGEVARFLGWIRRSLQRLGEALIFDIDPADPRPRLALQRFFTRLHELGALRGEFPEDAFSLTVQRPAESTAVFELEIAPAFPIDRIRLNISHDRSSASENWKVEVSDG